jgi:hypothetical protein
MFKNLIKKTGTAEDVATIFVPHSLAGTVISSRIDDKIDQVDQMNQVDKIGYINGKYATTKINNLESESHIPSISGIPEILVEKLLANQDFMNHLVSKVSDNVLSQLVNKYEFEPTDKYLEVVKARQQYINQLDAYLVERKAINQDVENDLQKFLNSTTASLSKAIESFGLGVQNRIKEAELRHGINVIRESLLQEKE